jgi:RNA polymerase sigma factor (sigma-70 family)
MQNLRKSCAVLEEFLKKFSNASTSAKIRFFNDFRKDTTLLLKMAKSEYTLNVKEKTDIEIIKESFKDPEAFATIYKKYYKMIFKHIYNITGKVELTRDLTEETFFRVIDKRDVIVKNSRDFGSYIVSIATNITLQYYRKKQKERKLIEKSKINSKNKETLDDMKEITDNDEEMLLNIVDTLPAGEHACIVMYYMEHKTMGEIAFLMNMSKSSISRKINSAKEKIYENLRNKSEKNTSNIVEDKK